MAFQPFRLNPLFRCFYIITAVYFLQVMPSRAALTSGTVDTFNTGLKFLMVVDDAAGKVYLYASGPVNRWFGWGFGQSDMSGYAIIFNVNGAGNYYESNIQQYVSADPQSTQNITASYCVIGDTVYYKVVRDLQTTDPNDYAFSANPGTLNTIWAMGMSTVLQYHSDRNATTFTSTNAPRPKVTSAGHGLGATTLTITNLSVGLTNQVEFTTDLGTTNWTTVSNLVFSPPCGPLLYNLLTNSTVNLSATNAAGFYRIKQ